MRARRSELVNLIGVGSRTLSTVLPPALFVHTANALSRYQTDVQP
jgi:hypothetical protein